MYFPFGYNSMKTENQPTPTQRQDKGCSFVLAAGLLSITLCCLFTKNLEKKFSLVLFFGPDIDKNFLFKKTRVSVVSFLIENRLWEMHYINMC